MPRGLTDRVYVVIPTLNEAKNLPRLLDELERVLQEQDFVIVVVDDNSPDGTALLAEQAGARYGNVQVIRREGKLGIGSAFNDGIKVALSSSKCKHIITMDGDFSHIPRDVPRLLEEARNADMVQGSRYVLGGRILGWSFSRRMTSFVANSLCRIFLRTGLHENTTSFRVYSRECAETVVGNVSRNGYNWIINSVLVAKNHGFRIHEVPIVFNNRVNGTSKLRFQDILEWAVVFSNLCFFARQ